MEACRQLVARRNDLIICGCSYLSQYEKDMLMYLISKVKPGDEQGKVYSFSCNFEFLSLMYRFRFCTLQLKNSSFRIKPETFILFLAFLWTSLV